MATRSLYLALLAAAVLAPLTGLYPVFLMICLSFILFACAFNLFTGYTGLLSIGHAAFFGMGAYVAGYAAKVWGFTPELALLAGVVVAAALGWVFGAMAIRRKGIYFAMITLALAQMVYFFCVQAPFTGAEDGLQNIPRGHLFGVISLADNLAMYYFALALTVAGFCFIQHLINAPFGQVLMAIRDNEPRAVSLGYDVGSYKLMAFVLSAALTGLAGGLKALSLGIATLTNVHWTQSGAVILMCLLGGLGTPLGPVIGAFAVAILEDELASMGVLRIGQLSIDMSSKVPVVIGLIFMVCVVLFRRGIVGEITRLAQQLGSRRGRQAHEPGIAPGTGEGGR